MRPGWVRDLPVGRITGSCRSRIRALWDSDLIALGHYYFSTNRKSPGEIRPIITKRRLPIFIAMQKVLRIPIGQPLRNYTRSYCTGNPNPFISLNYAIALYYDGQKLSAFDVLEELA